MPQRAASHHSTHQRFCAALRVLGEAEIFASTEPHDVDADAGCVAAVSAREDHAVAAVPHGEEHRPLPCLNNAGLQGPSSLAWLCRQPSAMASQDAHRRRYHLRIFEHPPPPPPPESKGGAPQASDTDVLRGRYLQVVKETVTAIVGHRLYTRLLASAKTAAAAGGDSTSTASRQAELRAGMQAYMNAVVGEESRLATVTAACVAHVQRTRDDAVAAPQYRLLAAVPQIPLSQWAGAHLYNGWCLRCATPRGRVAPATASAGQGVRSRGQPTTAPPKSLVCAADVEAELRRYWRLHDEAAARARLDALRSNDAEAFARHVSLLKVSALLDIMERTDAFMRRIGLRLQSQAEAGSIECGGGTALTAAAHDEPDRGDRPARAAARHRGSEYERFRAYVASTKNEYKLTHRVDAYVATQPAGLAATLLPHQMDGLRFLVSLDANRINGILADEMGVGKTLQTLAFLLHLKEARGREGGAARRPHHPHLVLAPLSVVREWREACEQFVAEKALRVAHYHELEDPAREAAAYDLVLLPIHAVRHVGAAAARVRWHYVVVDEAHKAVANLRTATAQSILGLSCERRLVLTGTPLSSDLQELWSLLHFLNPGVFADSAAFEDVFRRPFHVYAAREMELTEEERGLLILRLHQVLRPFLLRRTKADVDATLSMSFHHVRCPLTAMQQRLLGLLREQRRTPTVLSVTAGSSSGSSNSDGSDSDGAAAAGEEHMLSEPAALPTAVAATDTTTAVAAVALPKQAAVLETDVLAQLVWRYLPALAQTEAALVTRRAVVADRSLGLTSACVSESSAQLLCNHAFLLPYFSQVLRRQGLEELMWEGGEPTDGASRGGAAGLAVACSGKFLVLHLLLSRLVVARRKVVLFTHWLDCVDLLVDYLRSRGWGSHTEVLTGSSSEPERLASVRRFRVDPTCLVFLLSVKAGGCGINLQSAHMVVLLDRDYTATNEDQALARVYRIGQRHTVRAVYLTTADASEQRVTQRAAVKNKPRQAIINDGVYRVRAAADETAPVGDAAGGGLADPPLSEASLSTSADTVLDTANLWRCLADGAAVGATEQGPLSSPADAPYWDALSDLVEALDALVLTDEDRAAAAATAHGADVDGAYLDKTVGESAMARLLATRPPRSTAALQERLVAEESEEEEEKRRRWGSVPRRHAETDRVMWGGDGAADACTAAWSVRERAGAACGEEGGGGGEDDDDDDSDASAHRRPRTASPPSTAAADPLHRSALFWLEYTHLLRMASRGPPLLSDAVSTATANDAQKDNPALQQRRRRRRERRAAKRLRLATLDVPDAFREACWTDHGIDEEAEVAARYLRYLDARSSRRRPRHARGDAG
ncbi:SNF2 family N-terminal domain/Helicase conserved C-terminal domain containing protein [Novymonas esmeraldas]|uniref:SNF2 family N-terminal domain/Helicase conserved C-terminal domain containing protein n=1 Tax=Novymonas esmeraldas TaxID=1808958 RepID=A0AAW0EKT8_9TRYP